MPISINVNGLSLVHRGSDGVSDATLPDVCRDAHGVPVPYTNRSLSSDLRGGTRSIAVDGGNPAATKPSRFHRSSGDEPGSGGGVVSNVHLAESTWLSFSPNVRFEGQPVCRLTDKMLQNRGNTINCVGVKQKPLKVPKNKSRKATAAAAATRTAKRKTPASKTHKMEIAIQDDPRFAHIETRNPRWFQRASDADKELIRLQSQKTREHGYKVAKAIGATWLRLNTYWRWDNCAPPKWLSEVIDDCKANGLRVQVNLMAGARSWGGLMGVNPNVAEFVPWALRQAKAFYAQGVRRFAIWNEPNIGGFLRVGAVFKEWSDDAHQLTRLAEVVLQASAQPPPQNQGDLLAGVMTKADEIANRRAWFGDVDLDPEPIDPVAKAQWRLGRAWGRLSRGFDQWEELLKNKQSATRGYPSAIAAHVKETLKSKGLTKPVRPKNAKRLPEYRKKLKQYKAAEKKVLKDIKKTEPDAIKKAREKKEKAIADFNVLCDAAKLQGATRTGKAGSIAAIGKKFREIHIKTEEALHAELKGVKILMGDFAVPVLPQLLDAALVKGKPLYTDGIAFHPYQYHVAPWKQDGSKLGVGALPVLQKMIDGYFKDRKVMTRKKKRPSLYCTEFGYHRNKGKVDDNSTNKRSPYTPLALRERWLPRAFEAAWKAGCKQMLQYMVFYSPPLPIDDVLYDRAALSEQTTPTLKDYDARMLEYQRKVKDHADVWDTGITNVIGSVQEEVIPSDEVLRDRLTISDATELAKHDAAVKAWVDRARAWKLPEEKVRFEDDKSSLALQAWVKKNKAKLVT